MFETKRLYYCTAALTLAVGSSSVFAGTVIFEANFDGSTAQTATDESGNLLTNASVANLTAGTQTGTWSLSEGEPGAIVSNATGDNNAFVLDSKISQPDNASYNGHKARGHFTETIDLTAGEGLILEFDFYATRQHSSNGRFVHVSFDGNDGSTNDAKAYTLAVKESNKKKLNYLDTNGDKIQIGQSEESNNFKKPAPDSYLSWESGVASKFKVEILPGVSVADSTTGALLTVDWDGDGLIEAADGDVENVAMGASAAGVLDLQSFELHFDSNANPGARGAFFDNIVATKVIPEPASLALLGLGGLMMSLRRKRV